MRPKFLAVRNYRFLVLKDKFGNFHFKIVAAYYKTGVKFKVFKLNPKNCFI